MVRVIAEVGVNHNGSLDTARRLIDEVKKTGADAVKFQFFKANELASSKAVLTPYQELSAGRAFYSGQLDLLSHLELELDELASLQEHASQLALGFFVSVFSSATADQALRSLGISTIKIPSGEINNEALIRKVATASTEVLLSTGMSTIQEVSRAVNWYTSEGGDKAKLEVLQCTTSYPTRLEDVNLLAMVQIRDALAVRVGLSDHTENDVASLGAVALGATSIEKHVTLDREMDGPDHRASLEPDEFTVLVTRIRQMTACMGNGRKAPASAELENLRLVRKSPIASRRISRGETLTSDNIVLMRPQNGLDASHYLPLIGSKSARDYEAGDPIIGDEIGS